MATKKKMGTKVALGAGAIAAAAAAAAAGYYFYASKDAKQHRKIAAKWAGGLKKEVIKQAKGLEAMSRADVTKAVSAATAAYAGAKSIDLKELGRAAKELKDNWQEIIQEVGHGKRKGASAKRAASSAKKKVSKK